MDVRALRPGEIRQPDISTEPFARMDHLRGSGFASLCGQKNRILDRLSRS